jgi:DNA ligase-1
MKYSELCKVYKALESTTKGLEKTKILADFLSKIKSSPETIYLLKGEVFPDYDERELGISSKLAIKSIAKATGIKNSEVVKEFKKLGDLGKVAESVMKNKKQKSLFSSKLTTEKVLKNLQKLPGLEGKGTIERKISLIVELLHASSAKEAKYIIRTVISDMKVGVGNGLLRDAIIVCCFKPKDIAEKKQYIEIVQDAYDKTSDFAEIFEKSCKGKDGLKKISLAPGKPIKVMLFPKAKDFDDAFRIVGKPAAFEFKYDGFRMMVNKTSEDKISIFTRRLDNVTRQFPDVVSYVKKNIKGKSFIIDCEAVGYDSKTKKYQPFQAVSQRIKRKYDIEKLVKELPIELVVFDCVYYNGESFIQEPFKKRRKIIEKIVKQEKFKISLANQIVTEKKQEAEEFLERALKEGQEGLMAKSLSAPYKPGARIGYAVKLKPEDKDFDLVITGAEWGTGKRAGWLTSFDVSCRHDGKLLEIGKVSTGLKEKPSEGLSFKELTKKLKPLITEEKGRKVKTKAKLVVTVQYQNIQKSPTYNSGYALRFPRTKTLRPDRDKSDIATLNEIKKEAEK